MFNRAPLKLSSLKLKPLAIISILFIFLSGCTAHYGAAKITSTPSGVEVINADTGEVLGVTPLIINWVERQGTRKQFAIKLNKEGYYPRSDGFWVNMDYRSAKKATQTPNLVEIPMRKIGE